MSGAAGGPEEGDGLVDRRVAGHSDGPSGVLVGSSGSVVGFVWVASGCPASRRGRLDACRPPPEATSRSASRYLSPTSVASGRGDVA